MYLGLVLLALGSLVVIITTRRPNTWSANVDSRLSSILERRAGVSRTNLA
jgi:hypothetical protein